MPDFYEIWHSEQIELANSEYINLTWWPWLKVIDSGKFGSNTKICSNFYEIWYSQQIEQANYEYNTHPCLERLRTYWLRMIIDRKIRLTVRTWLIVYHHPKSSSSLRLDSYTGVNKKDINYIGGFKIPSNIFAAY